VNCVVAAFSSRCIPNQRNAGGTMTKSRSLAGRYPRDILAVGVAPPGGVGGDIRSLTAVAFVVGWQR